jgi:hypothetical protein
MMLTREKPELQREEPEPFHLQRRRFFAFESGPLPDDEDKPILTC